MTARGVIFRFPKAERSGYLPILDVPGRYLIYALHRRGRNNKCFSFVAAQRGEVLCFSVTSQRVEKRPCWIGMIQCGNRSRCRAA